MNVSSIIKRLGGTGAVAAMCRVNPASISGWKKRGNIPAAREQFLRLLRPDVFEPESETSPLSVETSISSHHKRDNVQSEAV